MTTLHNMLVSIQQ